MIIELLRFGFSKIVIVALVLQFNSDFSVLNNLMIHIINDYYKLKNPVAYTNTHNIKEFFGVLPESH